MKMNVVGAGTLFGQPIAGEVVKTTTIRPGSRDQDGPCPGRAWG